MESHGRRAPGVQHRAAILFRIRPSGDEPATIVDPESNAAQFRTLPVAMRATHAFGLLIAQSGAGPSQPEQPLRRPRPDRDDRIGQAMVGEQESLPAPPLCRRIDHSRRQRTRISDVDGHLDGEIERAGSGPRVDATTKTHGLPQRPFVRDRHASAVAGELAAPYCGGAVNFERIVAAYCTARHPATPRRSDVPPRSPGHRPRQRERRLALPPRWDFTVLPYATGSPNISRKRFSHRKERPLGRQHDGEFLAPLFAHVCAGN